MDANRDRTANGMNEISRKDAKVTANGHEWTRIWSERRASYAGGFELLKERSVVKPRSGEIFIASRL
jgi:hypothetical protein